MYSYQNCTENPIQYSLFCLSGNNSSHLLSKCFFLLRWQLKVTIIKLHSQLYLNPKKGFTFFVTPRLLQIMQRSQKSNFEILFLCLGELTPTIIYSVVQHCIKLSPAPKENKKNHWYYSLVQRHKGPHPSPPSIFFTCIRKIYAFYLCWRENIEKEEKLVIYWTI